jgi:hypothetical protein
MTSDFFLSSCVALKSCVQDVSPDARQRLVSALPVTLKKALVKGYDFYDCLLSFLNFLWSLIVEMVRSIRRLSNQL